MIVWTSRNIDHLAKHDVSPEEATHVLEHAKPPFPSPIGEGKYVVWGQTSEGRHLQVIFVYRAVETISLEEVEPHRRLDLQEVDWVVYRIHARELTAGEKRRFRRRRGR
jgi:uncharacterized DUF497 family protein